MVKTLKGLTSEVQREVVRRARATLKGLMEQFGVGGSVNMVYLNDAEAFRNDSGAQEALRAYHTETSRLLRLTHPGYDTEWYHAHREESLERRRRWRAGHLERVGELVRVWSAQHPGKVKEYSRRRRARLAKAEGDFTEEEFRTLCAVYDNRCSYCDRSTEEVGSLVPDHVIPLSRGGSNWLKNIAPACQHCNDSKGTKTADEFFDWLGSIAGGL